MVVVVVMMLVVVMVVMVIVAVHLQVTGPQLLSCLLA